MTLVFVVIIVICGSLALVVVVVGNTVPVLVMVVDCH